VQIRVYNSAGELVKVVYSGAASLLPTALNPDKSAFVGGLDSVIVPLPGRLANGATSASWDGGNDGGQWVKAGVYYLKLEAVDSFGQTTSLSTTLSVLPAPSESWLRIANDAGEMVWQQRVPAPVTDFDLSGSVLALAGEGQAGATLNGVKVTLRNGGGAAGSFTWDGRNSQGQLVASGVYSVTLSSVETGGQVRVETAKLTVLRGADADLMGSAVLGPNPVRGQDWVELRYQPQPDLIASAELFTLAGERVAGQSDPAQSGSLRFSVSNLSSGVYACVLHLGQQRRVMKLAVIR
jgi:hypothetical protein